MSVLKALKGSFQNVQQDIVDGFRALTSLDATPRHEKLKQLLAEGISLDGGADLLYRYQKNWAEMQNYTADSAKRAEEADSMIAQLFKPHDRQWQCVSRLEEEGVSFPALTATLDSLVKLVGSLQNDFKAVEVELDKLQNICEEEALEREKQSHMHQLAVYKTQKAAEVHSVKGKLWKMLNDKAKEMETRKLHSEKERQDALMEAFGNDMEYYRTHGKTDRLPSGAEFPKVTSLSEITIEADKKELDDFLSSGEHSDPGEGGTFIEDDYTADYSGAEERDRPPSFSVLDVNRPIDFDSEVVKQNADQTPVKKSDGLEENRDDVTDRSEKAEEPKSIDGSEQHSPSVPADSSNITSQKEEKNASDTTNA